MVFFIVLLGFLTYKCYLQHKIMSIVQKKKELKYAVKFVSYEFKSNFTEF